MAFHPRPQIASDLGCNVTRSFNPHRNRNQFPSGNKILVYGRRFKSQPASTRCDLRIASPTRPFFGRLIFIHLQCWEVLPFCRFQHQRCIKFMCPKDPDFYTPLALKTAKGQHLPALEVYKNQSPIFTDDLSSSNRKPAGRNRRIRAARRPQIAESPATRPLSLGILLM